MSQKFSRFGNYIFSLDRVHNIELVEGGSVVRLDGHEHMWRFELGEQETHELLRELELLRATDKWDWEGIAKQWLEYLLRNIDCKVGFVLPNGKNTGQLWTILKEGSDDGLLRSTYYALDGLERIFSCWKGLPKKCLHRAEDRDRLPEGLEMIE